jgi:hypothetical protein
LQNRLNSVSSGQMTDKCPSSADPEGRSTYLRHRLVRHRNRVY